MTYANGADLFPKWKADILTGQPPICWNIGEGGFAAIPLRPYRIVGIVAPPGGCKTALVCQWGFNGLRLNPDLRLSLVNVEMSPADLWDRELARLSGIPYGEILDRGFRGQPQYGKRIKEALEGIEGIASRVFFQQPPFAMTEIYKAVCETQADMLVIDYIQRIAVRDSDRQDSRTQITEVMNLLREIAQQGKSVIVVSAAARDKGSKGKAYENMGLGSFRDSSELEYGFDDAWTLEANSEALPTIQGIQPNMILRRHKGRYANTGDIPLLFDGNGHFRAGEVI
jgi:hypothetical protein